MTVLLARPQPPSRKSEDFLMVLTLWLAGAAAMVVGRIFGDPGYGWALAAALMLTGTLAWRLAPGTFLSRMALAGCLMAMVALQIQLSRGMVEFHFGVFVVLGLLLTYRDWRPIVFAAGLIGVHHVLFDRLQAAGYGVYCTATPSWVTLGLHAGYVVTQGAAEVYLAIAMSSMADRQARATTSLAGVLSDLQGVITTVQGSAAAIHATSDALATGHQDLEQRTQVANERLAQAADSMASLTSSVNETGEAAGVAHQLARTVAQATRDCATVVSEAVAHMGDVGTASRRIADVVGVIDTIAFQTSILALNASVEAARAGEQGRGFAIVASEVRQLAVRSAEAAREVSLLIGDSVGKVGAGVAKVNRVGETVRGLIIDADSVTDIMDQLLAAAATQARGIADVQVAMAELERVTHQNAGMVEQGTAAAMSLRTETERLAGRVVGLSHAPLVGQGGAA